MVTAVFLISRMLNKYLLNEQMEGSYRAKKRCLPGPHKYGSYRA